MSDEIPVPWVTVVSVSKRQGYRVGVRATLKLSCGHLDLRPASRGIPQRVRCYLCWGELRRKQREMKP